MTVTMRDVAKRAGVSVITVSRVVNESGYVQAETRARVRAAIQALHYIPNQMASSLRSRQTRSIALMLPTIANSFWTTIARGVEDEAEARGYSVFLCNTDYDDAKEGRYFEALLRNRVDGIAIVPSEASGPRLRTLQQRQMPLVQIHHKLDDVEADVVRSDSYGAAVALTQSLIDAGARHIAYIGGPLSMSPGRNRLDGFRAALTCAAIADEPDRIKIGNADPNMGYRLVTELTHAGTPIDAVMIANSRMAVGAIRALTELGKRIPEEIAIAAYYDIATLDIYSSALDVYSPVITTAIQPAYDMGRLSVRRLFERIGGMAGPSDDLILPTRIVPPAAPVPGAHNVERLRMPHPVPQDVPVVATAH
jgi:LacI family transcriptional regulator